MPDSITHLIVVSQESIKIVFLIAAYSGLDVWETNIQNAYLNALPREKVYFQACDKWGQNAGKPVLIVRPFVFIEK